MHRLPPLFDLYTDAYFLRSLAILKAENLNPFVRAQVFIREGPGEIAGISEVITMLQAYTQFFQNGGEAFVLVEGARYLSGETVVVLEGRVQDILPLETMMLGVLSAETTLANGGTAPDMDAVTKRMEKIVSLIGRRPVFYFGARHWRYDWDFEIAKAAFAGGATDASTDIGAAAAGTAAKKKGVGTIPHALECIYAWKYGLQNAVVTTTKVFDRVIDVDVPRVALIDFANREIDDTLAVVSELGERLSAVRVDTPGENSMQGARAVIGHETDLYWTGTGVTIGGVYGLRLALDEHGYKKTQILLSSGFGDPEKVRAFVLAEKELGLKLFDGLGVGELFPVRSATMDIVGVGETKDTLVHIAKKGRGHRPNPRLVRYG